MKKISLFVIAALFSLTGWAAVPATQAKASQWVVTTFQGASAAQSNLGECNHNCYCYVDPWGVCRCPIPPAK